MKATLIGAFALVNLFSTRISEEPPILKNPPPVTCPDTANPFGAASNFNLFADPLALPPSENDVACQLQASLRAMARKIARDSLGLFTYSAMRAINEPSTENFRRGLNDLQEFAEWAAKAEVDLADAESIRKNLDMDPKPIMGMIANFNMAMSMWMNEVDRMIKSAPRNYNIA